MLQFGRWVFCNKSSVSSEKSCSFLFLIWWDRDETDGFQSTNHRAWLIDFPSPFYPLSLNYYCMIPKWELQNLQSTLQLFILVYIHCNYLYRFILIISIITFRINNYVHFVCETPFFAFMLLELALQTAFAHHLILQMDLWDTYAGW